MLEISQLLLSRSFRRSEEGNGPMSGELRDNQNSASIIVQSVPGTFGRAIVPDTAGNSIMANADMLQVGKLYSAENS
jgi:hypothetical protein